MAATKTSPAGRRKIRVREGEILHSYLDSVGVVTCCVGHTGRMSPPTPRMGQTFTNEQSDAFLAADLAPVECAINAALKVPVTANEFDACASLWFNVGIGYVKTSAIIRRLNAGDIEGAARGFDAYHKPVEIIGRRNGEKAQFLTPDTDTKPIAAARAGVLETKASAAAKTAVTVGKTAAGTAAVGSAGAGAIAVASHPSAAIATGGAVVLAAIIQAAAAWWHSRQAGKLATNAAAQRAVAGA